MATRSSPYYLDTVIFQVEDELFKVPKYYFEKHSSIFRDMFSVPQPDGQQAEGTTDSLPLRLEGVSKIDFKNLLEIMYPLDVPDGFDKPQATWASALKLSRMWYFGKIRSLAISALEKMSLGVVDKILLALEYGISQWLQPSYEALVNRPLVLSLEECEKLGFLTSVRIFQLREQVLTRRIGTVALRSEVSTAFSDEIQAAARANSEFLAATGGANQERAAQSPVKIMW